MTIKTTDKGILIEGMDVIIVLPLAKDASSKTPLTIRLVKSGKHWFKVIA